MGLVNIIGENGLEVDTATDIITNLKAAFQIIYGAGINVDSNSPDGEMIAIFAQCCSDLLELLVSINNGFDPDEAQGAIQDQRVAINNIARIGGTYTIQPITIIASQTVTLQGLDSNFNNPNGTGYTVQDASGNLFILSATTTLLAGSTVCDFRAQNIGDVSVPINTIVTPVTIVAGITSVNNPSSAITVGVNEETDGALRIRRAASTANATSGNAQGLQGKLLALPGVTEAQVYQNRSNSTDGNGIPAHTVWVVMAGGASSDIANLIYNTISDGAGMRGAQSFSVVTPSGALFTAFWDNPTPEPLYISFTIKTTVTGFDFSLSAIEAYIAANLVYGIGQYAETSSITAVAAAAIAAQGGGGVPVLVTISSDDVTFTDYLNTTTPASEFTVSAANINITVV